MVKKWHQGAQGKVMNIVLPIKLLQKFRRHDLVANRQGYVKVELVTLVVE